MEIVVDLLYYTQRYNFVGVLKTIGIGILWKSDTVGERDYERDIQRDRIQRYDETYTYGCYCRTSVGRREGNESPCGR